MTLFKLNQKNRLRFVYLGGFLIALHIALVTYINSSLLGQYVSNSVLSFLYVLGSFLGILSLFLIPILIRKIGSISTFSIFIILEILAVIGMGNLDIDLPVIAFFLVFLATVPILYLFMDINLEQGIFKETSTGRKRGAYLTIFNIAFVLAPLVFAFLINNSDFGKVYTFSGLVLILLFLVNILFFKNTKEATKRESNVLKILQALRRDGDRLRILIIQFTLYFFYAWMVIYMPLLLSKEVGFTWEKIGIIFTIMLLPFLLLQFPTGQLADKKYGEKEFLIAGFIIMSAACLLVPQINLPLFWIWAAVLFISRIGASIVEIASESYFFKHVDEEDTGYISLFRMARPLAYIVAPLLAIPILYFFSYSTSFYFLAGFVLLGLFFIPKKDTK
ncbi:MAG: MFS transporter [Candidatus Zambryskibacteria bacterium]|nr:MFS transporter [Candidatus Zambryskibacteria bacterium]